MRKLALVFLWLLLGISSTASAQSTQATVDSLLQVLPSLKNDTNKVRVLCLISKEYFQLLPAKGVEYGEQALKLSDKIDYEYGIMLSNMGIGRCEAIQNNYGKGLEHFNAALSIARKLKLNEDVAKALVSIGNIYKAKGDYDAAIKVHTEAIAAYNLAGITNHQMVYNNIGGVYLVKGDYKKALQYFREGISMEEADKAKPAALNTLYVNIGAAYLGLQKTDSGLYYLVKALQMSEISGNKITAITVLNNIGMAYYALVEDGAMQMPDSLRNKNANFERGTAYLKKALTLSEEVGSLEKRAELLRNISRGYRLHGDLAEALRYYDMHSAARDTLLKENIDGAYAKAEAEFRVLKTTDSLKYENQIKDNELKKRRSDRNTLIAIITLFGVSGILLINRQKEKHIQRRKIAEAEKLQVEKLAALQMQEFTKNIQEKNDMIDAITAEIEKLKQKDDTTAIMLDETLLSELRQSILLTDEQWDSFKANFEKVHTGYLSRLRTKLPDLTPAEVRFIVLSKLKLSAREMAGMLGVSSPAVRASKYRLMKKLGYEDDMLLDALINNI